MRINLDKAYVPQAGDILSWISGEDKILFIVINNSQESDGLTGITLFDNRHSGAHGHTHAVAFSSSGYNYRLHLVRKANDVDFDIDQILDEWRSEE